MQINLIAMLSNKNENYFRVIMRGLIHKVNVNKREFNLDKIA